MRGGLPSSSPYGYAVRLGVGRSLLQLRGDVGGCGSKPGAGVEDTKMRGALMTVPKIFA